MRRLPRYYSCLCDLQLSGVERISSEELASVMQITSSQVRLDLSHFGNFGQRGYGYNIHQLLISIGNILGIYSDNHLILIGTGKLGRALLRSFPFSRIGFTVDAAFSLSPKIVGAKFAGIPVYPSSMLSDFVRSHQIHVAALTLPSSAAQSTVDELVQQGVTGFWNFTNANLKSDDPRVHFENIRLTDSLLRLNYCVIHPQQEQAARAQKKQKKG